MTFNHKNLGSNPVGLKQIKEVFFNKEIRDTFIYKATECLFYYSSSYNYNMPCTGL